MRVLTAICALCVLLTPLAFAQNIEVTAKPLTDSDIQLMRSDLQAQRNGIIAHTMQFTDAESAAFWPVYRDYSHEQQTIGTERLAVIKNYAQNADSLDDAKAQDLTERFLNTDAQLMKLRQQYWPKFAKALGAKRAARFYQVDNRLSLMINLQLASEIPLIP